jgi:hypothetical protein
VAVQNLVLTLAQLDTHQAWSELPARQTSATMASIYPLCRFCTFAASRSTPRSDLHEPSRDYFIKP